MKKKLFLVLLTGALTAGVCACGNKETAELIETTATEVQTEDSAEGESAAQEDTERVSDREDYVAIEDLGIDEYVTLSDYKNMVVQVSKTEVTDDNIKSYINKSILTSYPITDRAVATGDVVTIDYVGKRDGEAFDGGSAEGYQLNIGSGTFIDGFEDGLIGVMPGDTVDLNLTFPENYQATELAGVDVVFTVTVHNILESTDYDNVTDEQLALMSLEYDSKEAIWEAAKQIVEDDVQTSYQNSIGNAIIENLLSNSTFTSVPEYLVEEEVENYNIYMESICQGYYGVDLETFITNYYGMTMDEYNQQLTEMSEETIKQYLIMEAVARAEGIEITDDDITDMAAKEALEYGYDSAQDLLDDVGRTTYRMYMLQDKVMDNLMNNVTVEEPTAE